ncbi:MAG: AAA family ATPase, partial [Candidatus Omnitrophica bacterium]|nr:AAA family ATPase [Candidatus Omnitrophota bacterium]
LVSSSYSGMLATSGYEDKDGDWDAVTTDVDSMDIWMRNVPWVVPSLDGMKRVRYPLSSSAGYYRAFPVRVGEERYVLLSGDKGLAVLDPEKGKLIKIDSPIFLDMVMKEMIQIGGDGLIAFQGPDGDIRIWDIKLEKHLKDAEDAIDAVERGEPGSLPYGFDKVDLNKAERYMGVSSEVELKPGLRSLTRKAPSISARGYYPPKSGRLIGYSDRDKYMEKMDPGKKGFYYTEEIASEKISDGVLSEISGEVLDRAASGDSAELLNLFALGKNNAYSYSEDMRPYLMGHDAGNISELRKVLEDKGKIQAAVTIELYGREYLVTGDSRGYISLWDIKNNRVTRMRSVSSGIKALTTMKNADGENYLVSSDDDKSLRFWKLDTSGTEVKPVRMKRIATGVDIANLTVMKDDDGADRLVFSCREQGDHINIVNFDWDGPDMKKAYVVSLRTGGRTFQGLHVVKDDRGKDCLISLDGSEARVWSLNWKNRSLAGGHVYMLDDTLSGEHSGVIVRDDLGKQYLAVPFNKGPTCKIGLYELNFRGGILKVGTEILLQDESIANIHGISIVRDIYGGEHIAVSCDDGAVKIWEIGWENRRIVKARVNTLQAPGYKGKTKTMTVFNSPDGNEYLTAVRDDGRVDLWDPFIADKLQIAREAYDAWEREVEGPSFAKASEGGRRSKVEAVKPPVPSPMSALPYGFTPEQLKTEGDWHRYEGALVNRPVTSEDIAKGVNGWHKENYAGLSGNNSPIEYVAGETERDREVNFKESTISPTNRKGYAIRRGNIADRIIVNPEEIRSGVQDISGYLERNEKRAKSNKVARIRNDGVELSRVKNINAGGKDLLVTGDIRGRLRIWDTSGGTMTTIQAHGTRITNIELVEIKGVKYLATSAGGDEFLNFFKFDGRGEIAEHKKLWPRGGNVYAVKFFTAGPKKYLAASNENKTIDLIELDDACQVSGITSLKVGDNNSDSLEVVEAGNRVYLAAGLNNEVKIIKFDEKGDPEDLRTVPIDGGSQNVTAFPQGEDRYLAVYDTSNRMKLKILGFGQEGGLDGPTILEGHSSSHRSCRFVDISGVKYLASGDSGGYFKLWELSETGDIVDTLAVKGHTKGINDFAVASLDGEEHLVTVSDDGDLTFWDPFRKDKFHEAREAYGEWERSRKGSSETLSTMDHGPLTMVQPELPYSFKPEELREEPEWYGAEGELLSRDVSEDEVDSGKHGWFTEAYHNDPVMTKTVENMTPKAPEGGWQDEDARNHAMAGAEQAFNDITVPEGNTEGWSFRRAPKQEEVLHGTVQVMNKELFNGTDWAQPSAEIATQLTSGGAYMMTEDIDDYLEKADMRDKSEFIMRLKTGKLVKSTQVIKGDDGSECVVTGDDKGFIRIWDIVGDKVTTLKGHNNLVSSLTVLEEGGVKYLASGSGDSTIKLWELEPGDKGIGIKGISKVTTLNGHSDAVRSLTVLEEGGVKYLASGSEDTTLIVWDPFSKEKFHKAREGYDTWERLQNEPRTTNHEPRDEFHAEDPGMELPEEKAITESRYALRSKGRAMLLLEPGARERVIVNEIARLEKCQSVYKLEGRPTLSAEDLRGSKYPVLEEEKRETKEEFIFKKGFLTRHMLTPAEYDRYERDKAEGKKFPKTLLVVYNIDAIGEMARAVVNNLLLNGFLDIPSVGRMYLPDNVMIAATMRVGSQQEFSSAFPNRLTKVNIPAIEARTYGESPFAKYCRKVYGLDKYVLWTDEKGRKNDVVDEIELLFDNIRGQENKDHIWFSRTNYGFTVKDALTHVQFVYLALAERERSGEKGLTSDDLAKIIIDEAMRVYGYKVRQYGADYEAFIDSILKMQFEHRLIDRDIIRDDVKISRGKLRELAGIPVKPDHLAKGISLIDRNYRLTLVGSMVRTMSAMIRGLQAGKVVSFTGDTGACKTTMAVALARMMGVEDYVFSMHKDVKEYDMTGAVRMTDKGRFTFEIMEFAKKLESGNAMLIVDEANIKPEVLWILSGIARGEKQFTIERPGDKPYTFNIGKNVYVVFTMNPEAYGGGRGMIPIPIKEDIYNIWVPDYYEYPELVKIVTEFFGGVPELANITGVKPEEIAPVSYIELDARFFEIKRLLGHAYAKMEVEEVVNAIYQNGFDNTIGTMFGLTEGDDPGKAKEKYHELKEVERTLLAGKTVKKRMDAIRAKVAVMGKDQKVKIRVNFGLFTWWSKGVLKKPGEHEIVINVPIYELADRKEYPGIVDKGRSDEAISGLIIHELRHMLYSPGDHNEWREIGGLIDIGSMSEGARAAFATMTADPADRTAGRDRSFHTIWNLVEDIRIDMMGRKDLPNGEKRMAGAQECVDAMNRDFFPKGMPPGKDPIQAKVDALRLSESAPHMALRNELLFYGYNGEFSPFKEDYEDGLKSSLDKLKKVLDRAAKSGDVRPDMGKVNSPETRRAENMRAAAACVKIILEENGIYSEYMKWQEEAKKQQPDGVKGSRGGGGAMEGGTGGDRGTADGGEGEDDGGKPNFVYLSPEVVEEMFGHEDGSGGKRGKRGGTVIVTEGGIKKPGDGLPDDLDQPGEEEGDGVGEKPEEGAKPGPTKTGRARAVKEATDGANRERLKTEPINLRLSEVGDQAKQLAEGLINVFMVPEETDMEEAPYGRLINFIRFIMRSMTPFDEEVETGKRPDLALGFTADLSGSMTGFFPSIKKLSAIFISAFQRIGKKADFSVTVDGRDEKGKDHPHDIIGFDEKHPAEELNAVQNRVEESMERSGGGIHVNSCLEAIAAKHKTTKQKNKLEIIFTDGADTEGDNGEREGLFKELEKMGVSIVVVGFSGSKSAIETVFGKWASYILIDQDKPESIVGVLLNAARIKAKTGRIPKGNLDPMFDQSKGGVLVHGAHKFIRPGSAQGVIEMKTPGEIEAMKTVETVRKETLTRAKSTWKRLKREFLLETLIALSRDVISDLWRNNSTDIVIIPDLLDKPAVGRIVRDTKIFDKKYQQETVPLSYKCAKDEFESPEKLKESLLKACREAVKRSEQGIGNKGILIYLPSNLPEGSRDGALMKEILADGTIAPRKDDITVIYGDYAPGAFIDIVSHIILAKALLNYTRYKKGVYKGEMDPEAMTRLIEYMKVLVSDKEKVTAAYIDSLLNNTAILEMKKLDLNEITQIEAAQRELWQSV